jgi:replication factor C subunit 3/5
MELYAKTCRFIMICNNLSKIFDPLRSRCRIFCVPLPSIQTIENIIINISILEDKQIYKQDIEYILDNCDNKLKKAIWILESKYLDCNPIITLDEIFDDTVEIIMKAPFSKNVIKIFDKEIRNNIYKILITTIKGSEIIVTLMDRLIKRINNDQINLKIIEYASNAEYNLIHGRRDILNIDYFIMGVIRELNHHNYREQN